MFPAPDNTYGVAAAALRHELTQVGFYVRQIYGSHEMSTPINAAVK